MPESTLNQWLNLKTETDSFIVTWIDAFLVDRRAQNMSRGTILFYKEKLKLFMGYCDSQGINRIEQITPNDLRQWLLWLESAGHNPGGIHCAYRAVKTFLRWYQEEADPEGWKNPILRVKAPILPKAPLTPVSLEDIGSILETCPGGTWTGVRDRAIILALLDTGARASEFVAMDTLDYDPLEGSILIRQGKGRKPRHVYLCKRTRTAVKAFFKKRTDQCGAMWITDKGTRLTYDGLREIIRRRSRAAGIPAPGLHDFRRQFALSMLRNGTNLYVLAELMGHADIQVLQRYLALTDEDTLAAHKKGSPVENAEL